MEKYDVCILGGGASGLAAAASLDKNLKICLLEKNKILGRKIMATGGGRCNITNAACCNKDLTLDFFESLGMALYKDGDGRYYPYSNHASDVAKVLKESAEKNKADIFTDFEASDVSYENGCFFITDRKKIFRADKLIMASGGKAAPAMGTTGDGYKFAKKFGHKINKLYPVLTAIECGNFNDIKGVRARGRVSLLKDEKIIDEELGEIQFTEDGISGICVMNLTLQIKSDDGENIKDSLKRYSLKLDLAPDFTKDMLEKRTTSFGILSDKLSARVCIDDIKGWMLPVLGVKGWKNAQCTAGGIRLDEVNLKTMESKFARGLYIVGEILDFQGKCGGFNLQNAWETGIKAAKHINFILKGF